MLSFVFQSVKNPKTVYRHLQSLLGKKHDNLQVKVYQRCFPEHQLQGDPVRGTVHFNNSLWVFTSLFFSVSTFIYSCFYFILKIAPLSEELMESGLILKKYFNKFSFHLDLLICTYFNKQTHSLTLVHQVLWSTKIDMECGRFWVGAIWTW